MAVLAREPALRSDDTSQDMLFMHGGLVAAVALVHSLGQDPVITLVAGGLLSTVVYAVMGVMAARRAPLWLTPLSFYFLWYAIQLGPAAIFHGWLVSTGTVISFGVGPVDPGDLAMGYVLVQLGACCVHLGVQLMRPPSIAAPAQRGTSSFLLLQLVALWAGGIVAAWYPGLTVFLGALRTFAVGAPFAALCALVLIPRSRLGVSALAFWVLMLVGTAGLAAANLNSGSKASLMFSFLPLVWYIAMQKRLRVWLLPALAALALIYFNVVLPVVTLARASAIAAGQVATSPQFLIQALTDNGASSNVDLAATQAAAFGSVTDRAQGVLERLFDPAAAGFVASEVRANGFLYGESMQYASYAFIPRVVWPEKPTVSRGSWFAVYVGAAESEDTATVALGPGATGEWYWNFGVPGVIVGMVLYGILVGALWRLAGSDPRYQPLHMLLYTNTVLAMADMPEAVTIIGGAVAALIAFGLAFATLPYVRQAALRAQRLAPAG